MSKLSEDMVLIRKEKRLSKQDVFNKCRVPLETIYAIEDGSLFSDKNRNKTYLRSYVRTYAKAIGIRDEDITRALDQLETDHYDGFLVKKYQETAKGASKETPHSEEKAPEQITDSSDESAPSDKSDERSGSDQEKVERSARITPQSQEKTIEDVEWEDQSLKAPPSTSSSGYADRTGRPKASGTAAAPDQPNMEQIDWALKVKQAVYRPQRNRLLWVIIAILIALGIAVSSVYWFWQNDDPQIAYDISVEEVTPVDPAQPMADDPVDSALDPESGQPAPADVIETGETPVAPEEVAEQAVDLPGEPAPDEEMGPASWQISSTDTLFVLAYALHGNLEPVRVRSDVFATDESALRPYWVEHQEAMRFEFVNEIVLQGALSRMALIVNGHVIDDFNQLYMDGPRIRLTRDFLVDREILDEPPQTPFEEVPFPRAIRDRPRFTP
ncbi:helix-turn-helix domain-containing protein [Balneolales bacterium ANBcel1]|nr:helix-turn-helix domain-containing protein [Balneolales bacterium ANBcel1]